MKTLEVSAIVAASILAIALRAFAGDPPATQPAVTPAPGPGQVRVVSFNILKPMWQKPGQPFWRNRRERIFASIRDVGPDFLLTQEENKGQVADLLQTLPHFKDLGHRGSSGAIFYRAKRWEPVQVGRTDLPKFHQRYFLWGLFKEIETDRRVYVYTLHLPHNKQLSHRGRMDSLKLLAEHIAKREFPDVPVILGGDLNHTPETPQMQYLSGRDGTSPAKLVYAHKDIPKGANPLQSMGIDHILCTPGLDVLGHGVVRGVWDSGSDHPCVYAVFDWKTR